MPDLSREAVHHFWHQYEDPMIYRVVTFMEGVEPWTLDGQEAVETAITELAKQLDEIGKIDMAQLNQEDAFIQLACNIKMARSLRLLQALDTVHPGSASKLLIYAEENSQKPEDPAGLFLRRNVVFERLRLLARVFAPERFNFVIKALEGEEEGD